MSAAKKAYAAINRDPVRLAEYTRRAEAAGRSVWLVVSQEMLRASDPPRSSGGFGPDANGRDGSDCE